MSAYHDTTSESAAKIDRDGLNGADNLGPDTLAPPNERVFPTHLAEPWGRLSDVERNMVIGPYNKRNVAILTMARNAVEMLMGHCWTRFQIDVLALWYPDGLGKLNPVGQITLWEDIKAAERIRAEAEAAADGQILPLLWIDDIEPVLEARDFVEDVLIEASLAVVYGDSHVGKTFWTTDLALHVAAGLSWNGKEVDQGGVVYATLEGGDGFRNRVSAWKAAHPDVGKIPFAAIPCALNLLHPDADTGILINTIKAAARQGGFPVKLVVIDTLARAMAGGNENSPEDMGALVINADRIRRETGAALLFVHHSGKDAAKGARGHSSLRAAVDTEIEVTHSETSDTRTATIVKQRDMGKVLPFGFKLDTVELGKNQRDKPVTSCTVISTEAAPTRRSEAKLAPSPAILLDVIRKTPNEDYRGISRQKLRVHLLQNGYFPEHLLLAAFENGEETQKQTRQGYGFEHSKLTTLKSKGFINFNRDWVWLT